MNVGRIISLIAHHNDIMQSIREKDLEKTQNYLKEDLADFCG